MNLESLISVESYDLRKLSKTCNYKQCPKLPSKQAVILEVSGRSKKPILDLYFCQEHFNRNIDDIMRKLRSFSDRGKRIEKRVYDIGYITF